ncbi:MAG: hypothetical protein HY273_14805 [Gammaproteobacteria bacterium]|nr:hypothetical protein [Gammaproteobacteria bacterium]
MKKAFVLAALFSIAPLAMAGKTYQVTGPIISIDDKTIVVEKGKDKWEIARDAATKVTGDLKVGEKVTIEYSMTAASITAKEAKKK